MFFNWLETHKIAISLACVVPCTPSNKPGGLSTNSAVIMELTIMSNREMETHTHTHRPCYVKISAVIDRIYVVPRCSLIMLQRSNIVNLVPTMMVICSLSHSTSTLVCCNGQCNMSKFCKSRVWNTVSEGSILMSWDTSCRNSDCRNSKCCNSYMNPIISCFSKIQNGLSYWYSLTQVVLEK